MEGKKNSPESKLVLYFRMFLTARRAHNGLEWEGAVLNFSVSDCGRNFSGEHQLRLCQPVTMITFSIRCSFHCDKNDRTFQRMSSNLSAGQDVRSKVFPKRSLGSATADTMFLFFKKRTNA